MENEKENITPSEFDTDEGSPIQEVPITYYPQRKSRLGRRGVNSMGAISCEKAKSSVSKWMTEYQSSSTTMPPIHSQKKVCLETKFSKAFRPVSVLSPNIESENENKSANDVNSGYTKRWDNFDINKIVNNNGFINLTKLTHCELVDSFKNNSITESTCESSLSDAPSKETAVHVPSVEPKSECESTFSDSYFKKYTPLKNNVISVEPGKCGSVNDQSNEPVPKDATGKSVVDGKQLNNNVLNSKLTVNELPKENNEFQFRKPALPVPAQIAEYKPIYIHGISYDVLNVLGRGGSSTVYKVLHPSTKDILAIKKVNLTDLDPMIVEDYLNEVELLKNLQGCAHVIQMFDSAIEEKRNGKRLLYVVMENGETDFSTLIRSINKTTRISFSIILMYWKSMLLAVQEIHKAGVIHSDLKPANFVLVRGQLKLIDFGIASKILEDMTSVCKELSTGTRNYMSPEAFRNIGRMTGGSCYKVTYKSDVWSLGCILYNLLFGYTPFQHIKDSISKAQAIMNPNAKIQIPDEKVPTIFINALHSSLQRDPKDRATIDQLLEAIKSPFEFWDT